MRTRIPTRLGRRGAVLLVVLLALGLPTLAVAAFPGHDPNESVRANTPNDPGYDPCESDHAGGATCANPLDQDTARFGFAPSATQNTATYQNPSQTTRQQAQNTAGGRNALGQVSGVSADRAWKRSVGRPDVQVAILDTGIRWRDTELRRQVALNEGELPMPQKAGGAVCTARDCNGDGAYNVDDYAQDPRVAKTAGRDDEPDADKLLDASDLIATFSDGKDSDGNGYIDDIAGWDFFDDDNDPYDASSYSSADNHGSGRAKDAAADTNNAQGDTGVCPRCQIVPLRIWDTFVADTSNLAQAALYAADNHIEVVEAAIGGLSNPRFAHDAFVAAYRKGLFFAIVSSDLNTADHNIPTTYNESMMVQGVVPDTEGLGSSDAAEVGSFLGAIGIPTGVPVRTWFRNSGTTQYGGHAHIVMPATTGSQATGQAAGAAGLVISYARDQGMDLAPNEVKQLLTMTAEDVVPANTAGLGTADPAQPGWDQHFGYGRPDLGLALERIAQRRIPPQALITSPEWFATFNVLDDSSVTVAGRVAARQGSYRWQLQWAPGIEPRADEFHDLQGGAGAGPFEGDLGRIDLNAVRAALDARPGGGATPDPTAPSKGPGDRDPNEPAFTVRLVVTDGAGNRGEDRKVLFAYRDPTLHPGWLRRLGTGGEASERLWDVDGDGRLDIVLADSSGELRVLDDRGEPVARFNRGKPVQTNLYANVHLGAASYNRRRVGCGPNRPRSCRHYVFALPPPRESLRTPGIGDVDGDLAPDIVDTAGEHIYAWHMDGTPLSGFPVRMDPDHSRPQDRSRSNHVKRGFIASPTLADLDGDGALDIVAPALDGWVYALDGHGHALPGWPAHPLTKGLVRGEIITTAAAGDIAGDKRPEIVVATNEVENVQSSPPLPSGSGDIADAFGRLATNVLTNAIGGKARVYALDSRGRVLPGWPTANDSAVPDALPLVGPGSEQVMGNVAGDGKLEVIGDVAAGEMTATDGQGRRVVAYDSQPLTGEPVDKGKVINLFEEPIAADLDGNAGLEVAKGGITANQLVNLGVLVGQNLPYSHVMQAWNGSSGSALSAYPQDVEDYQLFSSPAVADVSSAPGRELLFGTGLYLLRDINAQGQEGAGFPKFTGGWNFAVPAVGDVDGDGKLEIASLTREGNAFTGDTDRPACGTNDQWWTSRHDERSTGAYGVDSRPPGAPGDVAARRQAGAIELSWKAPGDDWACGRARRYRVMTSNCPIASPTDGRLLADVTAETAVGAPASRTLARRGMRRRLAVAYADEAGNWGPAAQVAARGRALPRARDVRRPRLTFRARRGGRAGRLILRWRGTDRSAIACDQVQARPHRRGASWRVLRHDTRARQIAFRGRPGIRYDLRVRAIDEAGNVGTFHKRLVRAPRRTNRPA
ncbi:MAG: hypothetical protein QOI98_1387 [Solirubrobacteraceae bacterium]|nr:hypothetical protein [Solirubrobacteraceae bacterium]